MSETRRRLLELFKTRAVSFGEFTLASGQKSSYYINSKKVLFHSEAAFLLGEAIWEAAQDLDIQAVGGLEVGAIPMAAVTVTAFHRHGRTLEGFFVRKKAKDHGSQAKIEGVLHAGDKVVILDDVLTTGGSALDAVSEVERAGGTVARVVCIVDRLQGAREKLAGYDFRPLFTIRDLGIVTSV
jgi:orotate phosphoribosyltransferase